MSEVENYFYFVLLAGVTLDSSRSERCNHDDFDGYCAWASHVRKEVLQHLGIKPGDKVEINLLPDATGILKAAPSDGTIDSFIGLLAGRTSKVATLEEINATVAQAWAGKK
jgi:bifunctional DNA-binding transcriptional regulator/antitoxin component of YhaV-PrlF toxin-antitoxin module